MQIPLTRNLTLTATRIRLFSQNNNRLSFIIQNTGAANSMAVSFDGQTDSITLSAGQSLTSSTDDQGGADYKGDIYVSSSAGTTMGAVEISR